MSESFANKPPSNPDKDTFYTMGGLENLPTQEPAPVATAAPGFDLGQFIGSVEQLAQLYPGIQNRPEYDPGLSDIRYTRSFGGLGEPGSSFYSPSGAGNAPAPFEEQIIYQQPMIQPGGQPSINEALLGALFGLDWSGAYEDYINRLESQRDITDITNVVSPSITQNPNITVSPEITNTLEQIQQQTMGGGGKSGSQFQDDSFDFDFDIGLPDFDLGGGGFDSDFFNVAGAGSGARTSNQDDQLFEADLGLPSTDFGATNYRSTVGLNTVSPIINQSPSIVVSPTISNALKQQQAQQMGGGAQRPSTSISVSVSQETSVDTTVTLSIPTTSRTDTTVTLSVPTTIRTGTTVTLSVPTTTRTGTTVTLSVPTTTRTGTTVTASVDSTVTASTSVTASASVPVSLTDSEEAVINIYKNLFDREDVDEEGLDYWSSKLDAGTPLETLIRQIAGGAQGEDRSKLTPNEAERYIERLDVDTPEERNEFITEAYQELFDRNPDAEGRAYWNRELEQGKTPTEILRDLTAGAQETDAAFLRNTKTVNDLYRDLLGREADAEGREYFRSQLEAGVTPEQVARNLISGAKAGSEASAISQEEYDRYFKQPETSTPTSQSAVDEFLNSLTPERLQQIQDSSYEYGQLARELQDEARQYVYGMILTPDITPEQLREGFIRNVIVGRPDLLETLVGQSALDQHTMEYYGGEGGITTTGTDTRSLSDEIIKRANDPDYIRAALSIAGIFNEGSGGDSNLSSGGSGAIPVEALLSGGGAGLLAFGQSLLNGEDTPKAIANAATSAAVTAALTFGGPYVQAAYFLDKILAKEFGYDSFVQDGISYISRLVEKGSEFVIDKASEFFGGAGDFVGDIGSFLGSIGIDLGGISLAEGGLVDLPSETSYNYTDYYGGLGQMPQLSLDEVQPMAFAGGGLIPLVGGGKIARGPGGGLDDLIPTSIDGRRAAALSDGEFVIPADVVSMMGDGSTNAGSKRLYDLVRQVRQEKTGTSRQAGPLQVGKILERTMR